MKMKASYRSILLGLAVLGIAACAPTDDESQVAEGGIGGTGISSGPVTGFGSVFVNGVEFFTDNTNFTVNGQPGDESQLAVGMVVTVEGSVNTDGTTGSAVHISYERELHGVVLGNNYLVDKTLDVMGQTVKITADTVLELGSLLSPDSIALNTLVEVSGYSDGSGTIYATRLEVKGTWNAGDELELKGVVSNHSAVFQTFHIGAMPVSYLSAAQLENMPVDTSWNGLYVQVKSTDGVVNDELKASKVELEGDGMIGIGGTEGEELEIEGVVTEAYGASVANEFRLNGQRVRIISNVTEIKNGATTAALQPGVKVEVDGYFAADGVLVAEELEVHSESDVEISAWVPSANVNVAADSFTILGVEVLLNSNTIVDADSKVNFLTQLAATPKELDVVGYLDGTGKLVATKVDVESDTDSGEVELHGVVQNLDTGAKTFTLAGIKVDYSALSITLDNNMAVEVVGTASIVNNVVTVKATDIE